MRKALLDTDIFSEILKGKNETVRHRAAAYQPGLGNFTICTVTVMEVVKGLHKLRREAAVVQFLSGLTALDVIAIDTEIATLAGRIYADLERAGRPIGRADPLVAAAALVHDRDLVTGNVAHFEAVRSVGYPLVVDNWREPAAG
jgi:tRNA(fMet)-specific endonuclease VapC